MELAIRRAGYDMPRDEMCDASTKELGLVARADVSVTFECRITRRFNARSFSI